jgi:hypothetical protein
MRRLLLVLTLGSLSVAALAFPAAADAVYHSGHIPFAPVADAPLRSGFVENIHADGSNVFAHEQYSVNGAEPNTTYDVVLTVSIGDTTCTHPSFSMTTATITTDAAGNGTASHVFTPADAAGLRGLLIGGMWQLVEANTPVYATGCAAIQLD